MNQTEQNYWEIAIKNDFTSCDHAIYFWLKECAIPGEINPSLNNIIKHLGIRSKSTVIKSLKRLENSKLLMRKKSLNQYILQSIKLTNVSFEESASPKIEPAKENQKFDFYKELEKEGVEKIILNEFRELRISKTKRNSAYKLQELLKEIRKTDKSVNEIIKLCVKRDWATFEYKWLERDINHKLKNSSSKMTHVQTPIKKDDDWMN